MTFSPTPHRIFPTSYSEVQERIRNIDPIAYRRTRNFIDGAVTRLSPYISRGFISTKDVYTNLLNMGHDPVRSQKFIQELAWREYWQRVWQVKPSSVETDFKHAQNNVAHFNMPSSVVGAKTGIHAIDESIKQLYKSGYVHNHVRMYIASITCNIGQSHWKTPAEWMYYHLLDADVASNHLSWQWVAGTNSNKKYLCNQENINTYCYTKQTDTFLDVSYEHLPLTHIPDELTETEHLYLETPLPPKQPIQIDPTRPTCIYNFYNTDPNWKTDIQANRILLLEPSVFKTYPVSQKNIDFVLRLVQDNIEGIQIYVGEFEQLVTEYKPDDIFYKEHPLNINYTGTEEPRDWILDTQKYYSSFFAFWKSCKKQIQL